MVRRIGALVWAGPNSLVGLVFVPFALVRGGSVQLVGGFLECSGGLIPFLFRGISLGLRIEALTLGHVVLARSSDALHAFRAHERIHVRQYEQYGPLFLPAYFGSSALAFVRGRDPYHCNRFERLAYQAELAPGTNAA